MTYSDLLSSMSISRLEMYVWVRHHNMLLSTIGVPTLHRSTFYLVASWCKQRSSWLWIHHMHIETQIKTQTHWACKTYKWDTTGYKDRLSHINISHLNLSLSALRLPNLTYILPWHEMQAKGLVAFNLIISTIYEAQIKNTISPSLRNLWVTYQYYNNRFLSNTHFGLAFLHIIS